MIKVKHSPGGIHLDSISTEAEDGLTLSEIIEKYHGSTEVKAWIHGSDGVEWEEVPAEILPRIRPKSNTEVLVTYNPTGGKIFGGKNSGIFAALALIALTIVAGPIGTAIATSLGLSAFAGTILGGVILFGGSILINKLFGAQKQKLDLPAEAQSQTGDQADITSDVNPLGRGQYLAIAFGEVRVLPPDIVNPYFYLLDGQQKIQRLFGMNGEHEFWNMEVDGTDISNLTNIQIETKSGLESEGSYTFINSYSSAVRPNQELESFTLFNGELTEQSPSRVYLSVPKPFRFTTKGNDNLAKIDIILGLSAFYDISNTSNSIFLPIRLRVKVKGSLDSTFVNFPEVHIYGKSQNAKNISFQIDWNNGFIPSTGKELFFYFWQKVPPINSAYTVHDGSTGDQWVAHSQFQDGSGNLRVSRNTNSSGDGVVFSMLDSFLPRGADLEWEIIRGAVLSSSSLNVNYEFSGAVISMFKGTKTTGNYSFTSQENYPVRMSLVSATNVVADQPVKNSKIAQIAVQATQRSVRKFTTMASSSTLDWNGSSWSNKIFRSKNPATIYWNIVMNSLIEYGIDTDILTRNSAIFVAWRQECINQGYECNGVAQGDTLSEILSSVAQAGFADPVFSSGISVSYFHDTSLEGFRQRFNERDVRDIEIIKLAAEKPLGYKVRFNNQDNGFVNDEIEVTSDNSATLAQYETVSYKMITKESLAYRRAYFDLLQMKMRDSLITFTCDLSGIISEVGDIILFTSQIFSDYSIGFQVNQVIDNMHVAVDVEVAGVSVPASFTGDPSIENLLSSGEKSTAFFQFDNCVDSYTVVNVSGNVWRLNRPLLALNIEETRGTLTKSSDVNKRCIVLSVERESESRAKITLVEEKPEIYAEMTERF